MAKYSRLSRLPQREKEELILEFCEALASIKNPKEALRFIKDILTEQEVEMLAKRLRIARLLLKGNTYQEIQNELRVGYTTVARVSEWLRMSGEGYRMIVTRVKMREPELKDKLSDYYDEEKAFMRRYSGYYWPQLLIEDLAKRADKKQREHLRQALKSLGEKSLVYRKMDEAMREIWRAEKNRPRKKIKPEE